MKPTKWEVGQRWRGIYQTYHVAVVLANGRAGLIAVGDASKHIYYQDEIPDHWMCEQLDYPEPTRPDNLERLLTPEL